MSYRRPDDRRSDYGGRSRDDRGGGYRGRGRDDRSGYSGRGQDDRSGHSGRDGDDRSSYRGRGDRGGGYRGRGDRDGGYRGRGDRGGHRGRGHSREAATNLNVKELVSSMKSSTEVENVVIADAGERYGTSGQECPIVSNYFNVLNLPTTSFCQYKVDFDPEVPSIRIKNALLHEHSDILGATFTFDGINLFIPKKLPNDVTEFSAIIQHRKTDDNEVPETQCAITLTFINSVPSCSPQVLSIMNLMFKNILKTLGYKRIKRHYYDPAKKISFSEHGLEIWPGIQSAFIGIDKSLLLCCDVSYHTVMEETVYDRLTSFYNNNSSELINVAKKELIGMVVMTRYNNATYKISDIDFSMNPTMKFETKTGEISYTDYYRTRYQIKIKDCNQLLLVSIPKKKREANKKGEKGLKDFKDIEEKPVYLIPELCCITGMSDKIRSDFQLTRRIADETRLDPSQRSKVLVDLLETIETNPNTSNLIKNWGLKIEKKLMCIPGRTYPLETIFAGQNKKIENQDGDWTRNLRNISLVEPARLSNWLLVYSGRSKMEATNFVSQLITISRNMGFHVSEPRIAEVSSGSSSAYKNAIKDNISGSIQLVLVILDSPKKDVYDSIKKLCCCDLGVASQVVLQKTLRKNGLGSIIMKIGIQMNVKLGGEAWYVSIPIKNTMIIGIDVCHDPQFKQNSYGGMVASMNNRYTRYYSTISTQHVHGELIDSLGAQLQSSLIEFCKINGSYPEKIIVFRDGVGDGQQETVKKYEIAQMKSILQSLNSTSPPLLSFIIVKKRITSRLFTPAETQFKNPPPGTVVDKFITRGDYPNYYVISQCVRQGTVNPTHYVVIQNETALKTDHLQRLSYKLSHIYYNWSGTVRVPAPCQYAHKLCFIASNSIRGEPKKSLAHNLYYL